MVQSLSDENIEKIEKEFLIQGVARRLQVIRRCVENIYSIFPVKREELLCNDELSDVDINLHAFL